MRTFSEKLKNDYNDILKEYCITHNYKHIIADLKLNDWTYIFPDDNNVEIKRFTGTKTEVDIIELFNKI